MILKVKTIILTVLISIFYITGYSQSERILTTEATGDKNIYNHAFRILLLNMESKINKINSEEINNYYRHLYLVKSIIFISLSISISDTFFLGSIIQT